MGNFNLQQQHYGQLMTSRISCNAFEHACVREIETVEIMTRLCKVETVEVVEGAETEAWLLH